MTSLEERVAALEAEVIRLRERVTDTYTLAAHADRDVAEFREELRGQTDLINLTRLDMGELRERVEQGFAQTAAGFEAISRQLDRLLGEEQGDRG